MIKKFNIKRQISIRFRIFIAMTFLLIIAFGGIAIVTIPQFKNQSSQYHEQRLERKKAQLKRSISYIFQETKYNINKSILDSIFSEKIFEIADVQNVDFSIYSLDGILLNTTLIDSFNNKLDASVIKELKKSKELSIIQINTIENVKYRQIIDIDLLYGLSVSDSRGK